MFRGQLVILVCVAAYVRAGSNLTSNNTDEIVAKGSGYSFCSPGYYDIKDKYYEYFYDYKKASRVYNPLPNQAQVQCENSPYCGVSAAKISSVRCRNANWGYPDVRWDCDPSFYGSGYSISTSNINCEKSRAFSDSSTCVLLDSCIFTYVPQVSGSPRGKGSPVAVFAVFGGIFVCCAVGLAIFLCLQRMNRSNSSRGTTTTTVISTAPPPAVPTQAYTATQACPSAPCYPSQPDYPPPYAAPYPQYAPQYAQPEPPKYAPY